MVFRSVESGRGYLAQIAPPLAAHDFAQTFSRVELIEPRCVVIIPNAAVVVTTRMRKKSLSQHINISRRDAVLASKQTDRGAFFSLGLQHFSKAC